MSISKWRATPTQREHAEQVRLVAWFRAAYPQFRGCLFASANGLSIGGGNSRQKAAHWSRFIAAGGQKGVLDLQLLVPTTSCAGLLIEMKHTGAVRADVSDDQFEFIGLALRMGYHATWCAGAREAMDVIVHYLYPHTPRVRAA